MRELQRKQSIRRNIYSIPSLILLLIITLVLAKGAIGVWSKNGKSAALVKELEGESLDQAEREQQLKEDIDYLETEEGIENEIRERFSVSRDGEEVAIIIDRKDKENEESQPEIPWYQRLWHAIIGKL